MIKLVVADPMEPHRRIRRDHEIKRGAGWASACERRRQAARRDALVADKRHAHEAARGVWLKLEEIANLFGS